MARKQVPHRFDVFIGKTTLLSNEVGEPISNILLFCWGHLLNTVAPRKRTTNSPKIKSNLIAFILRRPGRPGATPGWPCDPLLAQSLAAQRSCIL